MSAPNAALADDSPYDVLARVYDHWQDRYGCFSSWVGERLDRCLDQQVRAGATPVSSFVDLGCGTGRLLLRLREAHPRWRLAGVDASRAMLAMARDKPRASEIGWYHAPLGTAIAEAPWDAVGCFFNTLNHLMDERALVQTFAAARAALRAGGLFLFDTNNRTGYERWWLQSQRFEGSSWDLTVEPRFDPTAGLATATLHIRDHQTQATVVVRERLHSDGEVERSLARAGLQLVSREPWSPRTGDVAGATWWVARNG